MGESEEAIKKHIEDYPDVDGTVVGDESRLRQIITNLARCVSTQLQIDLLMFHQQCV